MKCPMEEKMRNFFTSFQKLNETQHKLTEQIKTPNCIEMNKQNEFRLPNKMNYIISFKVCRKR